MPNARPAPGCVERRGELLPSAEGLPDPVAAETRFRPQPSRTNDNFGRSGRIVRVRARSDEPSVELRPAGLTDLPDLLRLAREFYDEDGFAPSDAELDRYFRVLFAASATAHLCLA